MSSVLKLFLHANDHVHASRKEEDDDVFFAIGYRCKLHVTAGYQKPPKHFLRFITTPQLFFFLAAAKALKLLCLVSFSY